MTRCFRFGGFALDLDAYVLTRADGTRVRLQRVPMDLLILLVERAGALVGREVIREALWGGDVFLEQDASINTAVRKIRRALGDAQLEPQFIETVVGKGYRFVAPVQMDDRIGLAISGVGEPSHGPAAPPRHGDLLDATRNVLSAAYDAYVRGRYSLDKRTEADLRDAVRWFQQSIDADPTYAPAYAGLADAYGQLGYGSYAAPEDSFTRARAAAEKALALDPGLADAHASLGYALMYYDWDFKRAEAEYRRAIELDPNYAIAHQWYAYLLTAMERPAEGPEREIAAARRLDPLSVPINIDEAYILHYYDRNEDALRSVARALDMNPKFAPGYFWLGRIYTSQGRYEEAELALQNVGSLRTWTPAMAVLGYLYAKSGRPAQARAILAEFDDLARQGRYASSYAIGVVYAGLGDRDAVIARLNDAVRERSHWLVWLKRDRRWDDVRPDPRFAAVVNQVGLP